MKKLIILLLVLVAGLGFAQEKSKKRKLEIAVAGNCDMCKKRIEKAAFSVKGVKMANWDVESKKLTVLVNEFKTDSKGVQKVIASIGHDTELVRAKDETYEALHGCCKYERDRNCKPGCAKECCNKKQEKSCVSSSKECQTKCSSKKS
ncbi:heavy-metal-associated domain-containing protein [Pseudofulvibacter geojedonensis]|uniref:Heavy-metal-associated domain-containing protein n=1 Tax=Pseudofulvibacter geojedonensis TaxID=1123758 RepID=A0ABW3I3H8_9FLAO